MLAVNQRARATVRRLSYFRILLVLCPALAVVAIDLVRRAPHLLALGPRLGVAYLGSALESTALWGLLLCAASRRRGGARWVARIAFVLGLGLTLGGQHYYFQQYGRYVDPDVSLFASAVLSSVWNQLMADRTNYFVSLVPYLALAGVLLAPGKRCLRLRRRWSRLSQALWPVAACAALLVPVQFSDQQASTPDTLYLSATGGLLRARAGLVRGADPVTPRERASLPVGKLSPTPSARRNVLWFILESVRSDAVCRASDASCQKTRFTHELLPDRVDFGQLRSVSSATAISLAVLWTGLLPVEDRDTLHTWPLLFDYARGAGWDTAYWTSQNLSFASTQLWVKHLGTSKQCSALDLDPDSDIDMGAHEEKLAARVIAEIDQLQEPFFAVVHLAATHFPYRVDEQGPQPFQPASVSKGPGAAARFFNHYLNSVHQQDRHVADIVRHARTGERGARTVVLYTSDHAEAFREHGVTGHTYTLYDEEVHVPGFIDAPPGTISDGERAALTSKRDALVFHVDFAPTVLDLIGVWDDPHIEAFRRRMPGTSLLRPELTTVPLPSTNCSGMWRCGYENWGVMQGRRKLEARAWDRKYRCWDVLDDPAQKAELPASRCEDLVQVAQHAFGRLPGKKKD